MSLPGLPIGGHTLRLPNDSMLNQLKKTFFFISGVLLILSLQRKFNIVGELETVQVESVVKAIRNKLETF